jgi:hypothetical protein
MHYLFYSNPFLPIGWHISRNFTELFCKAASGCLSLSKEFCVNPKICPPIERGGGGIMLPFLKEFTKFKSFFSEWLITYQLSIIKIE